VDALDRIEGSAIVGGPLPQSPRLKLLTAEIRGRVEMLRDDVEDQLFEEHGRLGFESEREKSAKPETSPVATSARETWQRRYPESTARAAAARTARRREAAAALRETVLASGEPTSALAERLGISPGCVGRIRLQAGESCAFLSGSGLTARQRDEIASSAEPTKALAERHSVAESLVNKLRKSGPQGALCAPAGTSEDI
jgi:hypothetical protein